MANTFAFFNMPSSKGSKQKVFQRVSSLSLSCQNMNGVSVTKSQRPLREELFFHLLHPLISSVVPLMQSERMANECAK